MADILLTDAPALTATAVAATAAATAAPGALTDGINTSDFPTLRLHFHYTGQVDAVAATVWIKDRRRATWSRWATVAPVLAPGGASAVDEVRDITPGRQQIVYVQLTTVTVTAGTVAVNAAGVWTPKSA